MLIKKTFSFLFKNFSLVAFFFLLSICSEISAKPYSQIAKEASKYNVLIEGIQSGSGVIIRKEGSIYRVITAGHVISDLKKGDELDLKTYDGKWHSVILQSIEKIGEVDLAIMDFYSKVDYPTAIIGKSNSIEIGSEVFVTGYALPSASVPERVYRFIKGNLISYGSANVKDGYQLLYSNQTLAGMSGGSVINKKGEVVGIHGRGETDFKLSEQKGVAIKTGTNQAVPLTYYRKYIGEISDLNEDFDLDESNKIAFKQSRNILNDYRRRFLSTTYNDFFRKDGEEQKEKFLSSLRKKIIPIIKSQPNEPIAYFYLGVINVHEGDQEKAIVNFNKSREMGYNDAQLSLWTGLAYSAMNNRFKAKRYLNEALNINPKDEMIVFWNSTISWEAKDIEVFDNLIKETKNPGILFSSTANRCKLAVKLNDFRIIDFCSEYLKIVPQKDSLVVKQDMVNNYIESPIIEKKIKGLNLAKKTLNSYPENIFLMYLQLRGLSLLNINGSRNSEIEKVSSQIINLLEGSFKKEFDISFEDLNWYKAFAYSNRGLSRQSLISKDVKTFRSEKNFEKATNACNDTKTASNLHEDFYTSTTNQWDLCNETNLMNTYAPWKNPNSTYCINQKNYQKIYQKDKYDKRCG
tara:strand:- start:1576 stop:3477 length:1902 start_codon:yes stop_codon:yes gene_type:complete